MQVRDPRVHDRAEVHQVAQTSLQTGLRPFSSDVYLILSHLLSFLEQRTIPVIFFFIFCLFIPNSIQLTLNKICQ